ncbi:trypsin inhibitor ClTI-1-like [Petromyzon marinus]|uniref:Trypsin inhibitor ClTI-1-like n=1 Tax=Petromyzon marinus TaxID=7757 RepID=A0AAJ7WQY8_PETMA|nr:trypsin inhibitor ClTI-1-like [Petromyzon marinus]
MTLRGCLLLSLVMLSVCLDFTASQNEVPGTTQEFDCERYSSRRCTRMYLPVCGTDGKTYPNSCMLCYMNWMYSRNVNMAHEGLC